MAQTRPPNTRMEFVDWENFFSQFDGKFLIGGDFNAHHVWWGSDYTRGCEDGSKTEGANFVGFSIAMAEALAIEECLNLIERKDPELGPTLPDGNAYSWIVLVGTIAIEMTVPCLCAMYGVILGFLSIDSPTPLDLWKEDIMRTPILFTAFLNLADLWTRLIVNLATIPSLVGLIGVFLLTIGVLASGYLTTGGQAVYLASVSAGAIMGIGGSFLLVQTDSVLQKNFRNHLPLALTFKEVSTSLGFIFAPGFIFALLSRFDLQIGLLLMSCIFIPTALGTLVLRYPTIKSSTSLYTLLISEEEKVFHSRANPDITNVAKARENNFKASAVTNENSNSQNYSDLFREGSDTYSYQDFDDIEEHFSISSFNSGNLLYKWNENLVVTRSNKFWMITISWLGSRLAALFIWILLPSLAIIQLPSASITEGVALVMATGFGTLIPNTTSYWKPKTARWRSFLFGGSSWLGSFVLLSLTAAQSIYVFIFLAFAGGISIAGTSVYLESTLFDALGCQHTNTARNIISTIVGLCMLTFLFIPDPSYCIKLISALQFIGGSYWILIPLLGIIQAR
ncbi:uncharacterized protein LOC122854970 isoform X3 [Aphidius gifuensis]|uniref:uncharacterized protein LOC122854970 isoform X3 n=1 Tax=Aphidius gifuensis TaxID=684658 RepID=UPI001CDB60DF|nr:uncharacterized protein LOC122854970 isoform X3 [Aphidius gifuensis]